MDRVDSLRKVTLFGGLSRRDLAYVAKLAETKTLRQGSVIIRQGADGNEFFVIEAGNASVVRGRKIVARLGPGDHFGELALLSNHPRRATVVADTPVTLLVLGRRAFMSTLGEMPDMAIKLLKSVSTRLREAYSDS
ncbi:MAG: cyclic nucleotide-binding domain-containing protein, partial [Actinomycetota bacterium]